MEKDESDEYYLLGREHRAADALLKIRGFNQGGNATSQRSFDERLREQEQGVEKLTRGENFIFYRKGSDLLKSGLFANNRVGEARELYKQYFPAEYESKRMDALDDIPFMSQFAIALKECTPKGIAHLS
jgi:hypothetical protein